jgi:hypothetical protein
LVVASVGLAGCATTVDTLTSRKFRQKPFETLFKPGDPLTVMRTSPEGDERAAAMRRLKEPLLDGRTPEEQNEAIQLLSTAATADPSPVVRVAAVDALGRFQDERAVGILTAAYHQASGVGGQGPRAVSSAERLALSGPTGFAPEMVTIIRTRTVESLAGTGRAEAVPVLTRVATGQDDEGPEPDRDVRLAAVRGLAKLRVPESAVALSRVLSAEKGKDPALAGRAHEGLVSLTGQSHPADPEQWQAVVQAGVVVVPEPDPIQKAAAWVTNPGF